MHLVRQSLKAHDLCGAWRSSRQSVGFVPTMGCLHDGHLSLIKEARERCDRVVVSIFVNPLQFGKNEDFGTYPRPFARDIEKCENVGVDMIFHPDSSELYALNFRTRIDSGPIGKLYCGKSRPGFFDGVLTVVTILLNIIKPNQAFFGEKDFQQLHLIKQLVRDFHIDTDIFGMPIIRETSGLAMSSRNEYLNNDQRKVALCLSESIALVRQSFREGESHAFSLLKSALTLLTKDPALTVDYAHIVDESSLNLITGDIARPARLLLAGYLGTSPRIRLIDNGRIN
jgi:pantoate--beta-alanine ligase